MLCVKGRTAGVEGGRVDLERKFILGKMRRSGSQFGAHPVITVLLARGSTGTDSERRGSCELLDAAKREAPEWLDLENAEEGNFHSDLRLWKQARPLGRKSNCRGSRQRLVIDTLMKSTLLRKGRNKVSKSSPDELNAEKRETCQQRSSATVALHCLS